MSTISRYLRAESVDPTLPIDSFRPGAFDRSTDEQSEVDEGWTDDYEPEGD